MSEFPGRVGLFSEGRNTNSSKLVERPLGREYAGGGQAQWIAGAETALFWG